MPASTQKFYDAMIPGTILLLPVVIDFAIIALVSSKADADTLRESYDRRRWRHVDLSSWTIGRHQTLQMATNVSSACISHISLQLVRRGHGSFASQRVEDILSVDHPGQSLNTQRWSRDLICVSRCTLLVDRQGSRTVFRRALATRRIDRIVKRESSVFNACVTC